MNPSPDDAAQSLNDLQRAHQDTRDALRYAGAAPILFIWGTVWMIGHLAIWPFHAWKLPQPHLYLPIVWGALVLVGVGLTIALASRNWLASENDWRLGVLWGTVVLFLLAWLAALHPMNYTQQHLLTTSTIMLAWVVIGLLEKNSLWITLGLILSAFIFLGYFVLGRTSWFWPWMAVFGGGGMLVSGVCVLARSRRHGHS